MEEESERKRESDMERFKNGGRERQITKEQRKRGIEGEWDEER